MFLRLERVKLHCLLFKTTKEQVCSDNVMCCSVTSVKISKRNVEKRLLSLLFIYAAARGNIPPCLAVQ